MQWCLSAVNWLIMTLSAVGKEKEREPCQGMVMTLCFQGDEPDSYSADNEASQGHLEWSRGLAVIWTDPSG